LEEISALFWNRAIGRSGDREIDLTWEDGRNTQGARVAFAVDNVAFAVNNGAHTSHTRRAHSGGISAAIGLVLSLLFPFSLYLLFIFNEIGLILARIT
jgi:hypothetical protein